MNSFGRIFRVSVLGESHGTCVAALIDGCPAGLPLSAEDFAHDLKRRQGGNVPGTTPRKEADAPLFESGVFEGRATGAPLLISFKNENVRSADYEKTKHTPRPGHADLVAGRKYGGFNDFRGGGHFSGRLTAPLVAAGVVAKKLLGGVTITASLLEVGGSTNLDETVATASAAGDSVGGLVECRAAGLPVGLGEPFFDSIESLISHAVFSIPAIKGIEFGAGFAASKARGSEINDEITDAQGRTGSNHSGGVNGGITNGNELVFRVAVKPTSSISKPQRTVNLRSGQAATIEVRGRHDACIALRVPVVIEAVTAFVLADLCFLEGKISRIWR